ncbi:class I SAM-dependent methyltransferase [Pararoseomonas indoligenes]|uniref:Methyltransferase domain-containing protein n=1 Tax=Roseomonas indoligenes TaxID=2820811 RepID=A0A940MX29_9PROT|nr:class I SAM-dependent methyltransferase [Pararoseomonas indoligenes]MBP0492414.1 methyltransferase domain-containing protein [Pararoseomonas indoligenes]
MEDAEYDLMDAAEDRMWWYRAVHARLLDVLERRPGRPALPVLDAGCGTGGFLRRLADASPRRAVGLDYNPRAAGRAAAKSGLPATGGTVNALPFPDASFGAAVSVDVICHAGVDEAAALAELHRVLAPGATLVLNLPAYAWLHSAHDRRVHTARRYTASSAARLLRGAGFAEVSAGYWNSLLLPLMVLQRKVLARGDDHASDVAEFPRWLDRVLHGATEAERRLPISFPAGGSVLVAATRP